MKNNYSKNSDKTSTFYDMHHIKVSQVVGLYNSLFIYADNTRCYAYSSSKMMSKQCQEALLFLVNKCVKIMI